MSEAGENVVSAFISTYEPPKKKEELNVEIVLTPEKNEVRGLVNKTRVRINYEEGALEKKYRLGSEEEWKSYEGEFEVTENTTIYAYGKGEEKEGKRSQKS